VSPTSPSHDRQWPNLFIVGAPKCGTTALWEYLRQHPQIYMSPVKEPYFFTSPDPTQPGAIRDQEDYLDLFDKGRDKPVRGEASPLYLSDPQAPYAIKDAVPDAKVVIALREPVARTYSAYLQQIRYGEDRTLVSVISDEINNGHASNGLPSAIVGRSFYADGVERYLSLFGSDVFVMFFEDLAREPRAVLRALFAFVGVDVSVADRVSIEVSNPFSVPRNALSGRLLRSPRARWVGRAVVPVAHRYRFSSMLLKPARKPPIDEKARTMLAELFEPDNERLRMAVGRSLPWS
jgi:sulfotransferase family protein